MRSLRALAAVLIAACAMPAWATQQIVLTSMLSKEDAPVGKLNYLIYSEAFRRLGYQLVLVQAPPLRGGVYAAQGRG
ncbi:hypothetical protein GTP45_00905 [Pseudoduganella sp. FT55W]|uniref:Uncharacterized protein n=1 Tax=Duganella rivi TaxID=2666083 RepID=A0A7X4K8V2_9BURK|nr:hypothetical protein [Duganella rivi]MYM65391.1 hypothetical protein [Duganella rivi]